ncbi:hypothetical protein A3C59_04980 [Candidatus Daviesbacteria bacterium RIFCSPHIGHO2_02_FULL_36_13]|uniref:Response regulatory domain-containing protein n=1 Tax=Candidatus Daviesbacteria bacterium RIFCSPHIGHO2_02_FULL_36_13 TaxID=1797768 RepID=A0A1F5JYV3_9BACT|nr:MAG: hypothetical protein A3C59_04980 [Candidatus Daviesbacteria bacterium RIFCSPHIGHO2_02_FULL_36_13]
MYFNKTILILEDNLQVLSKLLERLYKLEGDQPNELSVIVLTNGQQVQDYINTNPKASFDIALIDYDDKLGRTFHILEIERFGAEKVIGISSVPKWNEAAEKRGVKHLILKDYARLDEFTDKVVREIENMLRNLPN